MDFLLISSGLLILILSGKYLVNGSVALAQNLKLSNLTIAVTVVSAGTSFPELLVSINAAINHHPDIAIGNVIGSNIGNIALILGITALIFPIAVNKISLKTDWPVAMIITLLFYLLILDRSLSLFDGLILIVLLITYILLSLWFSKKYIPDDSISIPKIGTLLSICIIILSSIGLYFGADFLVKGASNIASQFGVSDRVISVSIIAIGTSLPELVTSVVAAFKKQPEISLGNILGSNIFNVAGILGITSLINTIPINSNTINIDMIWLIGLTLLLITVMLPFRKTAIISRFEGLVLLLVYISYIYILFL